MQLSRCQIKVGGLVAAAIVIATFGIVVARTVTRPLTVTVRTHIKICQKTDKGKWQVIDEVGPTTLTFNANLLELATGDKVSSAFVWQTKTKKGRAYSVRLLEPARIKFNPVNGRCDADLKFEITLDGKKASVPGRLTTESNAGPLGMLKGQRAKGILGRDRASFTLVSANTFQPSEETPALMLVCREEYTLTPKNQLDKQVNKENQNTKKKQD